jgi:hypothetical protein
MPKPPDLAQFWERGYAVAHDLADASQLNFAKAAIEVSERNGRMRHRTGIVPQGALNEYSPPAGRLLLQHCLPGIEAVVGRKLLPAYAFWRIYGHGAELKPHFDRESCEVSATMTIHADNDGPDWPIHFRDLTGEEANVSLPAGSAALYQGYRVKHWREPFAGRRQYQTFLHYVVAGGEFAQHAGDNLIRAQLGAEKSQD